MSYFSARHVFSRISTRHDQVLKVTSYFIFRNTLMNYYNSHFLGRVTDLVIYSFVFIHKGGKNISESLFLVIKIFIF